MKCVVIRFGRVRLYWGVVRQSAIHFLRGNASKSAVLKTKSPLNSRFEQIKMVKFRFLDATVLLNQC